MFSCFFSHLPLSYLVLSCFFSHLPLPYLVLSCFFSHLPLSYLVFSCFFSHLPLPYHVFSCFFSHLPLPYLVFSCFFSHLLLPYLVFSCFFSYLPLPYLIFSCFFKVDRAGLVVTVSRTEPFHPCPPVAPSSLILGFGLVPSMSALEGVNCILVLLLISRYRPWWQPHKLYYCVYNIKGQLTNSVS